MSALQPAVAIREPYAGSTAELVRAKRGRTISVCLPARDESATVGPIVAAIAEHLMVPFGVPLVDELIVLDDGSTDRTAEVARLAGAAVVSVADVLPEHRAGRGKGNVLWRSIAASTGDLIVWCDTDLTSFTPAYVTRLVAPLLSDDHIDLVKGFYVRPLDAAGQGGGRTTELVARPLLSMFFPPLATVRQPLGGECAARRTLLERIPFVESYGVESGLLIDALRLVGTARMAQVDLGVRNHRHRSLELLGRQASEITAVVLQRAGLELPSPMPPHVDAHGVSHEVRIAEQPPMIEVPAYRDREREFA